MATKLRKLQINEVSICDVGANPHARVSLFKRHVPEDDETTESPLLKRKEDDGRYGSAPKDYGRNFQAGGSGPVTDRLWISFDNHRRSMPGQAQAAFALAWSELSDEEKQSIRNEESDAIAAKQAQADAKQRGRQDQMIDEGLMADPNVVAKSDEDAVASATARIVKMAHDIAGGADNYVSRSNWYGVLKALAEQRRGPTETSAQAFTKFVTGDPDGRALFAAHRSASGPDFVVPEPVAAPVLKAGSAYAELRKIADGICEGNPALTRHQAFAKAFNENPELAARSKTEQAVG